MSLPAVTGVGKPNRILQKAIQSLKKRLVTEAGPTAREHRWISPVMHGRCWLSSTSMSHGPGTLYAGILENITHLQHTQQNQNRTGALGYSKENCNLLPVLGAFHQVMLHC